MITREGCTAEELYRIGARMCAGTEHCRSEVLSRLLKSTDDQELCQQVLNRLTTERYIDEERYVRAFAHDKLLFARWGRRKIQQELWRKGLPEVLYQSVLQEEEDEASYRRILQELLESKKKSTKGRNAYEIRMKLARFAASRGFETDLIFDLLGSEPDDSV